ncbi:MAG: translation initiation factor eIF-1A [Candidatus Hadarchaeaceae archaeon]
MPKHKKLTPKEEIERLRTPRNDEVLGVVEQMFGFDRLRVRCKDGHARTCRIRGKIRKRLWVRENDVVIIRPWLVQGEEKGDVIYRYTRTQVEWLRRKGLWE